jgi:hypothetical protein
LVTEFQMFDEFPNIVAISPLDPTSHDGSPDEENPNADNNDPNSDVDDAVDVDDARVVGSEDIGAIETPETVAAELPAGVAAAWATAAACPPTPPGLVVFGGSRNGFNAEAVAEATA